MSIDVEFQRAKATMFWVQERLDGRELPGLPTIKRQQLASGCLHVAVEHSQAIVVLVEEKLFASALALVRLLFESYLRGTWLLNAASDAQIDDAGRDRFPAAGVMVDDLEKMGMSLTHVKQQWWNTVQRRSSFSASVTGRMLPRFSSPTFERSICC